MPTTIPNLPTAPSRADPSTFSTRADAWVAALDGWTTAANTQAGENNTAANTASAAASTATTQASNAATSASSAINAPGTSATSTTSMLIGLGVKNIVLQQTGKAFTPGQPIVISRIADPTTQVAGVLLSHNPANGNFSINATTSNGSGTYTDWNIALGIVVPSATTRGAGGTSQSGNQTLTVGSAGVQRITTTAPGQWIKLPNATTMQAGTGVYNISNIGPHDLEVQNAGGVTLGFILSGTSSDIEVVDTTTVNGIWVLSTAARMGVISTEITFPLTLGSTASGQFRTVVELDSTRELLLFAGDARLYAVVWDNVNSVFGTPVLVRTAAISDRVRALKTATDQTLVMSHDGTTALQGVILSTSGTAITVNTAASATTGASHVQMPELIQVVGQGYIVCTGVAAGGVAQLFGVTVSGTTVTIGAGLTLTGTVTVASVNAFDAGSGKALVFSYVSTPAINALPVTMSGTTLTAGTLATVATNNTAGPLFNVRVLTSGRWALLYVDGSTLGAGAIVSVSGTTASMSTAVLTSGQVTTGTPYVCAHVVSSQVLAFFSCGSVTGILHGNVLTDNAGTAVAGTSVISGENYGADQNFMVALDSTSVSILSAKLSTNTSGRIAQYGISGNNPTMLAARYVDSALVANGGFTAPSLALSGRETMPAGLLRGTSSTIAGLQASNTILWQTVNGLPIIIPSNFHINWTGSRKTRSAAGNFEWASSFVYTGTVVAVQRIKVV